MRWTLFLALVFVASACGEKGRDANILVHENIIYVSGLGDSIKVKTFKWGLAGGHEKKTVYLQTKKVEGVPGEVGEISFLDDSPLFYKANADTLFLFSDALNDSTINCGNVHVIHRKITTLERINFEQHYPDLGLKFVGAIPK